MIRAMIIYQLLLGSGLTEGKNWLVFREKSGKSMAGIVRATERASFHISEFTHTYSSSDLSHWTVHQIMFLIHQDLPSSIADP